MAEGPGFEPGLTGPEPVVLPLDDPSEDCHISGFKTLDSVSGQGVG